MLEELAKRDSEWRKLALQICGCPTKADDLVQEMYLKLSKYNKKFNTAYVYYTMKHIYLQDIRKGSTEVSLEDWSIVNQKEPEGYTTQDRYDLIEMIDELHWFEREVLLITHEMSLRKAEDETGIYYGKLNYHKQKGLNKLKEKYGSTERQKD